MTINGVEWIDVSKKHDPRYTKYFGYFEHHDGKGTTYYMRLARREYAHLTNDHRPIEEIEAD